MKINLGKIDRTIRIILGIILITLAATGILSPWGWIGLVFLLTGLLKFCPAYNLLGMNSCPMQEK